MVPDRSGGAITKSGQAKDARGGCGAGGIVLAHVVACSTALAVIELFVGPLSLKLLVCVRPSARLKRRTRGCCCWNARCCRWLLLPGCWFCAPRRTSSRSSLSHDDVRPGLLTLATWRRRRRRRLHRAVTAAWFDLVRVPRLHVVSAAGLRRRTEKDDGAWRRREHRALGRGGKQPGNSCVRLGKVHARNGYRHWSNEGDTHRTRGDDEEAVWWDPEIMRKLLASRLDRRRTVRSSIDIEQQAMTITVSDCSEWLGVRLTPIVTLYTRIYLSLPL